MKKVTICNFVGADWCFVIADGEVYFRGHYSDFGYELVYFLNDLGVKNGLDLSEEYL